MIVIVDSGSTKSDWIFVDRVGNKLFDKERTHGLNPEMLPEQKLRKSINESKRLKAERLNVSYLFFYGAGCGTERPRLMLKGCAGRILPKCKSYCQ